MSKQLHNAANPTPPTDAAEQVFAEIIPPRTKVYGSLFGVFLLAVIVWSFMKPLHDVVPGQAIFYYGLENIQTSNTGIIRDVLINAGEQIKAGDPVAYLQQPDLEKQIEQVKAKLDLKRASNLTLTRKETAVRLTALDALNRQIANLSDIRREAVADVDRLRALTGGIAWSDLRLEQRRSMINAEEYLRQILEADSEQAKMISFDLKAGEKRVFFPDTSGGLPNLMLPELRHLDSEFVEQEQVRVDEEAIDRLVEIRDLEAELELLMERLKADSVVTSRYSGKVVEVKLSRNELLKSGASLALIEVTPEDLEKQRPQLLVEDQTGNLTPARSRSRELHVIAFLPAATAKKAMEGNTVRIMPGYLPQKAYGYMEGKVRWISKYPATEERMTRLLRNPTVVSEMQQTGTTLEFHIDISEDERGEQKWKSLWNAPMFRAVGGQDPPAVTSGTLCTVQVEVRRRRPIGLVFPIFE